MLQKLDLSQYRNFASLSIEFDQGFTVLWGHNGAGKTNILEAIYFIATLRSFRSADLKPLLRRGQQQATVGLRYLDRVAGIPSELLVRLQGTDRGIRRLPSADGKAVRSAVDFYGRIRAILFTPEDLAVLRGSPAGRRQFLDRMLFAREREHIVDVQAYERLLKSRNHILRDRTLASVEQTRLLDTYEFGLADAGARIWQRRAALTAALGAPVEVGFGEIHGESGPAGQPSGSRFIPKVDLAYESSLVGASEADKRAALAAELLVRRGRDLQRGSTSVGPHRDDLVVRLDGELASATASQGQTRALVLALKLAELDLAREHHGEPPLLLLDDVSSELDPARTEALFVLLAAKVGQCVLTTTAKTFVRLPSHASVTWRQVVLGALGAPGGTNS